MKVVKRNGSVADFNKEKISAAVRKAFESQKVEYDSSVPEEIFSTLGRMWKDSVNVEAIQDLVETTLMKHGYYQVAKAFILYREKRSESRFIRERIDYMDQYSQSKDNAATSSETDANANVTMKNVANLEGEVYKTTNRIIQRQRMKDKLNEMFPEVAKQYEKDLEHHIIYAHDEATTPVLKQYCMAVSLYPLMTEGVGNIDGVTPSEPNDLSSFSGQITNLAFLLSSQCKGAVAFGEYFIALNYYIIKEFGKNWYEKLACASTSEHNLIPRTIRDSILKAFKQFVWGINQPAGNRSYQSPFTNISYYDKTYFESLFGGFYYPDGTQPEWKAIDTLQRMFMKWFNKLRLKQVLTFPVETLAMVHDGKDIVDKDYKELCAEMYAEGHSFFTYISDSADSLASCCFVGDELIRVYNVAKDKILTVSIKDFVNYHNQNCNDQGFKILVNYKIESFNPETGIFDVTDIIGILKKKYNGVLYKITAEGNSIEVTADHILLVVDKDGKTRSCRADEYVQLKDELELMIRYDHSGPVYVKPSSIETREVTDFEVYDIELLDNHWFAANNIVTHNCRLRNELAENTFNPTSGLTGVMTGSCNVITLNVNRIVQDCNRAYGLKRHGGWKENTEFIRDYLKDILGRVYKYHIAFKTMLYDLEDKGMFAASNGGYIHISKLYSTVGINGLNEAARFLGMSVSNNEDYIQFLQLILSTIKEQNKLHSVHDKVRPILFNSEVVPAEGLGSKNYNWDKKDGYVVPDDENLYNSYFYNAHDDTSVLDKFILHGKQTSSYCDGGSALHCNLEDHLSKEQYLKLIDFAIGNGTNYFTFNIPNSKCEDCGKIIKKPVEVCPVCGSRHITQYTRIIGYLRPIKTFGADRQIEAARRTYSDGRKELC